MQEPDFLDVKEVRRLHLDATQRWGGDQHLRDELALNSAVDAARWRYQYEHGIDEFDLAATYAFHIAEDQPFVDGNKRAGAASAIVFLGLAGFVVPSNCDLRLYEMLIEVSTRKAGRDDLAQLLRELVLSILE